MSVEFWHFELIERASGASAGHVVISPAARYIGFRRRATNARRLELPGDDWSTLAGLLQAAEQPAVATAIVVRVLPSDLRAACMIDYLDRGAVHAGQHDPAEALHQYLNQAFAL